MTTIGDLEASLTAPGLPFEVVPTVRRIPIRLDAEGVGARRADRLAAVTVPTVVDLRQLRDELDRPIRPT